MDKKPSMLQFTMTYGAILGGLSIVSSLLMYLFGYMPTASVSRMVLLALLKFAVVIVFVSTGMKNYRDKILGGSITFFQALYVGLLILIFETVLSGFYDLVFNLYIDPGYANKMVEAFKSSFFTWMNLAGTPQKNIDELMDMIEKSQSNSSPLPNFFSNIYSTFIFGTILSLIVASFTKKNQNPVSR
ncbi:MAG TPA: DUF4199 domain-containing protein [Bacteroidales bacterium]|nr:DUF4199 domain-containing protein [Bacteroidales bacterium]